MVKITTSCILGIGLIKGDWYTLTHGYNLPTQVGTIPTHIPFGLEPSPPQVSFSFVLSPKLLLQEYVAVVPNW